jgi:hypothetical protein
MYACVTGSYHLMGSTTITATPGSSTGSPFVHPLVNKSQNRVYVKCLSGEIWSFDLGSSWAPEFIFSLYKHGNFLIDEKHNFLYGINAFGDLVRVNIQVGLPHTPTVLVPIAQGSIAFYGGNPVLQWRHRVASNTNEICIQIAQGGYLFPNSQEILRFDPQTVSLLPPLISQAASIGPQGINPSNGFAFGPDGDVYVLKAYVPGQPEPQVWRYDGLTGAFKSVFIATGLSQNITDILFAPDGQSLLVTSGNVIIEFDLTGAAIGGISLIHPGPGSSTFFVPRLGKPTHAWKPPYAYLVSILAGLVGDNPGWVRRPGHHWPEPWGGWERSAELVWNGLDPADKDAVIAVAIRELGSLLEARDASEQIESALKDKLSDQTRSRLDSLLKRYDPTGERFS